MNDNIKGGCFQIMEFDQKTRQRAHKHYANAEGQILTDDELQAIPVEVAEKRGLVIPKKKVKSQPVLKKAGK